MVRMNGLPVTRQQGQIFPLSLAVLVIACVMFFVVFNSGRAVNEKINLVNAADASAYSGAQIAARHLNFMAYTNRAMIANEAAIGHLYSFQVETDLLGKLVMEGVNGGGFVGDLLRGILNIMLGGLGSFLDLVAQVIMPIIDSSKVFTGMLSLMMDENNVTFANFQQQAYLDLIQRNQETGYTVVDETMAVVAASYLEQARGSIRVNDPDTLRLFEASEDPAVAAAALQAGDSAAAMCEMILFATPSPDTGAELGSSYNSRSQNCRQSVQTGAAISSSILGSPGVPEADGGLMLGAIRETVSQMDNATWIRDRNVRNYTLLWPFSADRAGATEIQVDSTSGNLNWVANSDTFTLKLFGIPIYSPIGVQGDSAANVKAAVTRLDAWTLGYLQDFGLCGPGVDCQELAQNGYHSIQRFAALDPNRQSATITAFLSQENCSDGIGRDQSGDQIEGWNDGLRPFEEQQPFCDKTVYAIGQAEVYFQRPDCYEGGARECARDGNGFSRLNDGAVEVPNLYNPFWHARLIATGAGGGNG